MALYFVFDTRFAFFAFFCFPYLLSLDFRYPNTYSTLLQPSWLGYFLSTTTISIGTIILIENLIENEIISILILIIGSIFYVWASIQISEQVIFFIGGLGLVINLPRLITEILPDNIWPPLILFLIGGVLVVVGLYLNSIRENIKTTHSD